MKRSIPLAFLLMVVFMGSLRMEAVEKSIKLPPDNRLAKLKPGPGVEVTQAKCGLCHSADYIVTQPRSDGKRWAAAVRKMIQVYGAPLTEQEEKMVVDYLSKAYSPERH